MDGAQGTWVVALFLGVLAVCALLGFLVDLLRGAHRRVLLAADHTGWRRDRARVMTDFYNHAGGLG